MVIEIFQREICIGRWLVADCLFLCFLVMSAHRYSYFIKFIRWLIFFHDYLKKRTVKIGKSLLFPCRPSLKRNCKCIVDGNMQQTLSYSLKYYFGKVKNDMEDGQGAKSQEAPKIQNEQFNRRQKYSFNQNLCVKWKWRYLLRKKVEISGLYLWVLY